MNTNIAEDKRHFAELEPLLDHAIDQLDSEDRDAILQRFFEKQNLREIGERLGISENSARMRVSRAIEKLHTVLSSLGVSIPLAAVSAFLGVQAVGAAPAALAASLGNVAFASSAIYQISGGKIMAMSWLKYEVATVVVLVALGTGFIHQQRTVARGQSELARLHAELAEARDQNQQLTTSLQGLQQEQRNLRALQGELLRLRNQLSLAKRAGLAATAPERPSVVSADAELASSAPPFQLQLVVDEPGEDSELVTREIKAPDGSTSQEEIRVSKSPLMGIGAVLSADVITNNIGQPSIEILFTDEGRGAFAKVTRENLNKRLAISLKGQVYSAPVIRSEISGGKAEISGAFTVEEANELAAAINEALHGE